MKSAIISAASAIALLGTATLVSAQNLPMVIGTPLSIHHGAASSCHVQMLGEAQGPYNGWYAVESSTTSANQCVSLDNSQLAHRAVSFFVNGRFAPCGAEICDTHSLVPAIQGVSRDVFPKQ
jgi:hypothetical protein